jgi:hypothetical protein
MAVPVSIDGKSILTLYSIHSKKYTKVSKISISSIPRIYIRDFLGRLYLGLRYIGENF